MRFGRLLTLFRGRREFFGGVGRITMASFSGADRIKGLEKSVWVEFTGLARECNAVNLGQGFPDYPAPSYALKALAEAAGGKNFLLNQYTRSYGHPRLINILGKLYSKFINHAINPNTDILVTVGAYNAIFYAVFGLLNPGEEAIIIEPYYDCYEPVTRMAGGVPVFMPLKLKAPSDGRLPTSADFHLDIAELESKFSSRTKLLFLNCPNNPCGKVYTEQELSEIARLVKKHNVVVISDEVYEWIVYGDRKHIRFASLPDMWERTITIGSAGKSFSVTGWKLGWAIGPESLMRHLQAVHQNCVYTCPTPTQEAVAVSFELEAARLDSPECYFNSLPNQELLPKRDRLAKFLLEVGMTPIIPEGGYFMLADYSKLRGPFDEPNGDTKDYRFCRWLCKEKKVAGIPPSAFYGDEHKHLGENYIRFCFFKHDSTLDAAEKIIKQWKAEDQKA